MKPIKKWTIIRHVRALICAWHFIWKGVSIWRMDFEQIISFYKKDDEKARRIWNGEE